MDVGLKNKLASEIGVILPHAFRLSKLLNRNNKIVYHKIEIKGNYYDYMI
jgi:hypothetical protein